MLKSFDNPRLILNTFGELALSISIPLPTKYNSTILLSTMPPSIVSGCCAADLTNQRLSMPVQHSSFNTSQDMRIIGNFPLLPLRTRVRGPAFPTDEYDILDEVVDLFRVNSFFRNFEIKGPADRALIYGILFVNECLTNLRKTTPLTEANKQLNIIASDNFSLPGEPSFPLNSIYAPPGNRVESDTLWSYLSQFRQELAARLIAYVYATDQQAPSKYWLAFSRKRFMNLSLREATV